MSKAIITPTTSRRRLLAGSAVGSIATAIGLTSATAAPPTLNPITSPNHPDAQLIAACQSYVDFVLAERARDEAMTEEERRATYKYTSLKSFLGEDRPGDMMAKAIAAIPAKTLDGAETGRSEVPASWEPSRASGARGQATCSESTVCHWARQEILDLRAAHPELFKPKLVVSNLAPRDGQRMTFSPLPALFKINGALTSEEL